MAAPDFTGKTVNLLCKRAGSLCSNPSCLALTTGPTADQSGSMSVGEAAHIFGARPRSKRYRADMTDSERAEITNGIWLCRNCHKKIDADEVTYPVDVLFEWRRSHQEHVASKLGRPDDLARVAFIKQQLPQFASESLLAQQILIDKPEGWEYRLTAELLRSYLEPALKRWRNLTKGLVSLRRTPIKEEDATDWFHHQFIQMEGFFGPLTNLFDEFTRAWGEPGVSGDVHAIWEVCRLVERAVNNIVDWEEEVRSVAVPEEWQRLYDYLPGIAGSQLEKLEPIPNQLNQAVDWAIENPGVPRTFVYEATFELPDDWERGVEREKKRIERQLRGGWW